MKRLQKLINVSNYLETFSIPGLQDIKPIRVVDGDNVVGITMQFTKNTKAAKINTPYIIKTTRDISEFEVNAKVNPGNTKKSIVIEDDDTGR